MRKKVGVIIYTETHKLVARNIHGYILDKYNINLDLDKLSWGSIAPDILPYYKLKRHYQEESINFISKEIVQLIFLCRYVDFSQELDPILNKLLSKKIGVISHYLCDYTCHPHAYRMTFVESRNSLKEHIRYESDLNEYAKTHIFVNNVISTQIDEIKNNNIIKLLPKVKDYINKVVEEYKTHENSFATDLNFALNLNVNIASFIIEGIINYSEDLELQYN